MDNNLENNDLGRYANVLLDGWFKRFFGEGQERFLTLLIETLIPGMHIIELSYTPQEKTNPVQEGKNSRVDVDCKDANGTRFIVEVQVAEQKYFYERALYYSSFDILTQMKQSQDLYNYPPVITIGIMKFSYHKGSPELLFRYALQNLDGSGEWMTDRQQFVFLELPNIANVPDVDASLVGKLSNALLNMHTQTSRPKGYDEELLKLLYECAEIGNLAAEEQARYRLNMTTERDRINQLAFAKEQGLKQGQNLMLEQFKALAAEGKSPEEIIEILQKQGGSS